MDDADELLRRCQRGDGSALTGIVRLFEERIFRLAWRVLGDAGQAEEATADALAKVWSRARQWRGEAAAGTWIYQVAVRTVLDCQRRRRGWWRLWAAPPAEGVPDPHPGPPEQALAAEGREMASRRVEEALRQLSADDRALVHLYYFEERGLGEIAAIVGVARETLKMRLARARGRLRDLLKDFHEGP